jgi:hypothetical protein
MRQRELSTDQILIGESEQLVRRRQSGAEIERLGANFCGLVHHLSQDLARQHSTARTGTSTNSPSCAQSIALPF